GNIVGFTKVTHDLTERMLAEKTATQHREDLEAEMQRVRERDIAISKALEKQKNLTQLRKMLITSTSRKFDELYADIYNATKELGELPVNGHEGQKAICTYNILTSGSAIKRALNNLLWLAKADEQDAGPDVMVDVEPSVKGILTEMEPLMKTGQGFEYIPEGNGNVSLPDKMTEQIMTTLLTNAISYSPENSTILIRSKHAAGKLELSVQDAGIGIPAPEQGKVFHTFFRGSNTGGTKGVGISLYISHKL